MPGSTLLQGLTYPVGSDGPDGPGQMLALANSVEKKLVMVFDSASARTAAFAAAGVTATEGMLSWQRDTDAYYRWTGSAWRNLEDQPRCKAVRITAGVAFTSGVVNMDSEQYDSTGAMHSTGSNLARVVAPEDGLYDVKGHLSASLSSGTSMIAEIRLNANAVAGAGTIVAADRFPAPNTGATSGGLATEWQMSAGDYVEMFATFPSSMSPIPGAQNTWLSIRRVGPVA